MGRQASNADIKHFLYRELSDVPGQRPVREIVEYSAEEAAAVAMGDETLPEFSGASLRYVQVWVDQEIDGNELQVRTASAVVRFDENGRFADAEPADAQPDGADDGSFEHDTCVQLAVRKRFPDAVTVH